MVFYLWCEFFIYIDVIKGILEINISVSRRNILQTLPNIIINHFTSRPKCMPWSIDPGITMVNPTEISVM